MYDVNTLDLSADTLTKRFDKFNISVVNVTNISYEICRTIGYTTMNYQIGVAPSQGIQVEQVDVINNYNQRPQNDPYSNTYNSCWRNHPNFSYKNN